MPVRPMDMIYIGEARDVEEEDQRSICGGHPLHCFVNDERTRSFLALPIGNSMATAAAIGGVTGDGLKPHPGPRPPRHLLKMIGAVNKAFVMHGLKVYYKVRSN